MTGLEWIDLAADTMTIGRTVREEMKHENLASKIFRAAVLICLIALVGIGIIQKGTGSEPAAPSPPPSLTTSLNQPRPASPPIHASRQDMAAVQDLRPERTLLPTYHRPARARRPRPSGDYHSRLSGCQNPIGGAAVFSLTSREKSCP